MNTQKIKPILWINVLICAIILSNSSFADSVMQLPVPSDNNADVTIPQSNVFQTDDVGYINKIGSALWRQLEDFEIDGDYAFCLFYDGIKIIDISDPATPLEVSRLPITGTGIHLKKRGDYLYLAAGEGGVQVIDVSDPFNPTLLYTYSKDVDAQYVTIVDTLAYVANKTYGVLILSVADPVLLSEISRIPTAAFAEHLDLLDTILYVADTTDLEVFNITDLQNAIQIGSYSWVQNYLVSEHFQVIVSGTTVIARQDSEQLTIYDAADPFNLIPLKYFPMYSYQMAVQDTLLYLTRSSTSGGFSMYSIADPANTYRIAATGLYGQEFQVVDTMLYLNGRDVTAGTIGFENINITDIQNPQILGTFILTGIINDIKKVDSLLYVLDQNRTLHILNIADSTNPQVISQTGGFLSYPVHLQVEGTYAYVTVSDSGLQIIDVSDPVNPVAVGRYYRTNNRMDEIEIRGTHAYICDETHGLYDLDISDPANPTLYRLFAVLGGSSEFAFDDTLIWIGDYYDLGMRLISIGDPENPYILRYYKSPFTIDYMDVMDSLLIMGSGGFYIYNISNLDSIPFVSSFSASSLAYETVVDGNIFYCINGRALDMFLLDRPETPLLIGSYPAYPYTYTLYAKNNFIVTGGQIELTTFETNMNNAASCFVDTDNDEYGTLDSTTTVILSGLCDTEPGTSYNADDCDDTEPTIYPGAPEIPYDGIDQNCDGHDQTCCIGQRGNIDGDPADAVDVSDLLYFVDYMFVDGAPPPPCNYEADVDGTIAIDISDLLYLVDYMFLAPPGPAPVSCY